MGYADIIRPVVEDWSYFDSTPIESIKREALNELGALQPDIATVIQGVRRCGKSTLLTQIMSSKNLPRKNCYFVNFEDPRLTGMLDINLLASIVELANASNEAQYFFFDEIQAVPDWQKWLRTKLDKPTKNCFVLTGSNSSLLSGELGSVLTGRHLTVELFPFNLTEYQLTKPKKQLADFLEDGGFPRALSIEEPDKLLRQYFTDIIERDVRRFLSARSTTLLTQVTKAVFESAGSELSARKLAKQLDTSTDTVLLYLEALTQAYMILPCHFFTFSERKRAVRNTKWYPIDTALRRSVSTIGSQDLGKDFETVVFHQLRKVHKEVFYWKGAKEVDFVVLEGTKPRPIQVSWDGIKDRHKKAIEEFQESFPDSLEPRFLSKSNFA